MRYSRTLFIITLVIVAFSMAVAAEKEFTNSLGMKFVLVPAGTFTMGSPPDEPGRSKNEVRHQVRISKSFYMQTTPVTQGAWKKVMGYNPSYRRCGDDCPVDQVSWNDVQEFIVKLNSMEGTNRYRLPTEAEWEYAARAGTQTAFANGGIKEKECGYDPNLDRMGWYCGNSGSTMHPVAQKQPNAWGLYDMHGNVYEWVQDWYGDYPARYVTDPVGPSSGSSRVIRGGSWRSGARECRSADRSHGSPAPIISDDLIGFRLARKI